MNRVLISIVLVLLSIAIAAKLTNIPKSVISQEPINCEDTFHDYYMRYPYVEQPNA